MSYCKLITFVDGKPKGGEEYRNAWGGAARIWNALFDRYVKDPAIPYHNWMSEKDQAALWALAKRDDLPMAERAVHASTFDFAFVRREHFGRFADDLRSFCATYPAGQSVCHLQAWAALLESLPENVEAIGFHGTSVAENPWWNYNEQTDESLPKPLSEGFEVYDWLASLGPNA